MEAFSPIAEQAIDFLIAIAEPVSRPLHMHEYKLTPYSLYAAVSVGLETNAIVEVLNRLSKVPVPDTIIKFIRDCTESYGKVKLVLKQNKYYVESNYPDILQKLLQDEVVRSGRILNEGEEQGDLIVSKAPTKGDLIIPGTEAAKKAAKEKADKEKGLLKDTDGTGAGEEGEEGKSAGGEEEEGFGAVITLEKADEEEGETEFVQSFEIGRDHVEDVRKRCNEIDYPMLEEYDFRNDTNLSNLDIDLKPTTVIRPYQEKALSKMFGNGRARSGIIVLPCGAGKTLVGITAACTIKKSILVLCTSGVSVEQWIKEFRTWTNVKEGQVAKFTSETKERVKLDFIFEIIMNKNS